MIYIDHNKKLAKILKAILENERKLDNYRQILNEQDNFSAYNLFKCIDIENKNFIEEEDLISFLR